MAKSIQPVIDAFWKGKSKKVSNTETDGSNLWLFNNKIAKKGINSVFISDGGYDHTVTTQNRLNMLGAEVTFRKGQFYIKGVKWKGDWIKLGETPEVQEIKKQTLFS
jgi:hypothetical protein